MNPLKKRLIALLLSISVLTSAFGCATKRASFDPIAGELRRPPGTIAVVIAQFTPALYFNTFAKSRGAGAGKGAAAGAARGTFEGTRLALSGGGLGVFLLPFIAAGGAVIGGTAGAITGTIQAVPAGKAQDIERIINEAMADLNIQETMGKHIRDYGRSLTGYHFELVAKQGPGAPGTRPDYMAIGERDIDSVFEITVNKAGFEDGKGSDPAIAFAMDAITRLIHVQDGKEVYSRTFTFKTRARRLAVWADDNARLLQEELERCYGDLAERIVEDAFLVVDFPLSSWSLYQFCMMRPLYPECKLEFLNITAEYVPVGSLQPTLRWESFPRKLDVESDRHFTERVSGVTYDLKIWKADDYPETPAYTRQRLPNSYHRIEDSLEPSTKYFWTVRASFNLDGRQQVTRWSCSRRPFNADTRSCIFDQVPPSNAFRFMTPYSNLRSKRYF